MKGKISVKMNLFRLRGAGIDSMAKTKNAPQAGRAEIKKR